MRPGRESVSEVQWGVRASSASTGETDRRGRPDRTRGGPMETKYRRYVGIDWATQSHQVCVIDGERRIVDERQVEHSGEGVDALAIWLTRESEGEPAGTAVA